MGIEFEELECTGKKTCLQCGKEFQPYHRLDLEGNDVIEDEFCSLFCCQDWYADNRYEFD